jgi:DNA-binding beta-propeller fold protein YncE
MKISEREKMRKVIHEAIRRIDKPKPGANYVIHNDTELYIYVDSCGWPVFDDKLYPRTTRFTKKDAEIYVKNLGYKNLEIEKIKSMGELNENQ